MIKQRKRLKLNMETIHNLATVHGGKGTSGDLCTLRCESAMPAACPSVAAGCTVACNSNELAPGSCWGCDAQ